MEWWAAVLTNATEKEITSVLWPFVGELVLPPDINLSGDTMAVDYANNKIRSKLGVIRGMGDASIEPIVNSRPYKDIRDFVAKDVAGNSLSHKLIHVGVLDSLFPPKTSLLEKLKIYEDEVERHKFQQKLESKTEEQKAKMRQKTPKEGAIPEEYLDLDKAPFKDVAMKKSVLPSLPIDLHRIARKHSSFLDRKTSVPVVIDDRGEKQYRSQLINGEMVRRLDETDGDSIQKDIYVAATAFVLDAKEFSYAKSTKKALKLVLDIDGYVSEKVLWPEYETGRLVYPQEVKKGAIITVFMRKRVGKKDINVMSVKLEA
jgi:DNA polymerase III alpha subunit